jgi:hypothetical protein
VISTCWLAILALAAVALVLELDVKKVEGAVKALEASELLRHIYAEVVWDFDVAARNDDLGGRAGLELLVRLLFCREQRLVGFHVSACHAGQLVSVAESHAVSVPGSVDGADGLQNEHAQGRVATRRGQRSKDSPPTAVGKWRAPRSSEAAAVRVHGMLDPTVTPVHHPVPPIWRTRFQFFISL